MIKKRSYFVLLISVLTVISICGLIVVRAKADIWGRAAYHGYFDGQLHSYGYNPGNWSDNGYVLPPNVLSGVNSVSSLVSTLKSYYNQGDPWYSAVSFIVDTMLGRNGGGAKGVTQADWDDLTNRLNNVSIDWHNTNYSTPYNTYHMSTATKASGSRTTSANDVGWATDGQGPSPSGAIVMSKNGVTVYALFKSCANPAGALPGLPTVPPPAPPAGWSLSGSTTAPSGSYWPGDSVTFTHTLTNSTPSGYSAGTASFTKEYRTQYGSGGYDSGYSSNGSGSDTLAAGKTTSPAYKHTFTVSKTTTDTQVCDWIYFKAQTSTDGNSSGHSTKKCVTIKQPKATCSALVMSPALPEPDQQFQLAPYISYDKASIVDDAGSGFYLKLDGTAVQFNKSLSGEVFTLTAKSLIKATAGVHTVTWGVNSGSVGAVSCSGSFTAGYHPYFTAIGGDVAAGAGYANTSGGCTQTAGAIIKSWNNDTYPYFGAATELAALALGKVTNFASATNPGDGSSTAGQSNKSPTNLTFANKSPAGSLGNLACSPDYYDDALALGSTTKTSLSGVAGWSSGIYKVNSKTTLGTAGSDLKIPADGRRVTLVINGDLNIVGNKIVYDTPTTTKNIPRLTVIVKGNIYISNTITELHGAYIAQPNGSNGGTVYSCAVVSGSSTPNVNNNYADCGSTGLTVYGAVVAQNLNLGRSVGGLAAKRPAEVFQFTPELWIGGGAQINNDDTGYDSITSLPPTL